MDRAESQEMVLQSSSSSSRSRGRLGSVMGLVGTALGALCVLGLRFGAGTAGHPPLGSELHSSGSIATEAKASYSLTYHDFVEFGDVKAFLKMKGIDESDWTDKDVILDYVPRELTVELDASKVRGTLGAAAEDGYVVTGLTFTGDSGFESSYVVVLNLKGDVEAITSLYGKQLEAKGMTSLDKHTIYQALGLKMYNTTHVLVAFGDSTGTLKGPRALWGWRQDTWMTLCDGKTNDAHDIQWAYDEAAVWQADGTTRIEATDVVTGKNLQKFAEKRVSDPNHVQAVAEDQVFYVSSRQTDAIVKMNVDGAVEWSLGGEYGDYKIEDSDGKTYAAGKTVWSGQHNAEYFGDDEFCMFDNQEKPDNLYSHSRLLCVKLEKSGASKKGVVTFSYFMGAYTPHFGDNDRLPTGNQLGVHWPDELTTDVDYDVRAVEVVRSSGDLAWELKIMGVKCEETKCARDNKGWTSYSMERFYTAPIISSASCSDGVVTFDVVNNFKQMNLYEGSYLVKAIVDDDDIDKTDGTFDFLPHWRQTALSVDVPSSTSRATIYVTNQFGDESSEEVSC